jgi:phage shock protein C
LNPHPSLFNLSIIALWRETAIAWIFKTLLIQSLCYFAVFAGVCGGIAEYFNVDATIIRLILVILLLPGGLPGVVPYVIMWVIVPEAPQENIDQNTKS